MAVGRCGVAREAREQPKSLARAARLGCPAGLSCAVTVHHAHFTVGLVVALRFAKAGIRVCLRSLSCTCAARKQRPERNENYKRSRKHVFHLDLLDTQVNL